MQVCECLCVCVSVCVSMATHQDVMEQAVIGKVGVC